MHYHDCPFVIIYAAACTNHVPVITTLLRGGKATKGLHMCSVSLRFLSKIIYLVST